MQRVRLETAGGELVTDEEYIPPFKKHPEVIVWGSRFFAYAGGTIGALRDATVYREAFTYCITGTEKTLAAEEKA